MGKFDIPSSPAENGPEKEVNKIEAAQEEIKSREETPEEREQRRFDEEVKRREEEARAKEKAKSLEKTREQMARSYEAVKEISPSNADLERERGEKMYGSVTEKGKTEVLSEDEKNRMFLEIIHVKGENARQIVDGVKGVLAKGGMNLNPSWEEKIYGMSRASGGSFDMSYDMAKKIFKCAEAEANGGNNSSFLPDSEKEGKIQVREENKPKKGFMNSLRRMLGKE